MAGVVMTVRHDCLKAFHRHVVEISKSFHIIPKIKWARSCEVQEISPRLLTLPISYQYCVLAWGQIVLHHTCSLHSHITFKTIIIVPTQKIIDRTHLPNTKPSSVSFGGMPSYT